MKNPSKKTTMKGSVGPKGGKGKMAGPQGAGPAKPGGVSVSTPGAQKWGVSGEHDDDALSGQGVYGAEHGVAGA